VTFLCKLLFAFSLLFGLEAVRDKEWTGAVCSILSALCLFFAL
jgi:hypothetical protein